MTTATPDTQRATIASSLRALYFVRFAFAIVWAIIVAFTAATVTPLTATLLVLYPVFDVALIYMLTARWREMPVEPWRRTIFLLFLSALSYGVANGIQFCVRMASVDDSSNWATLFWSMTDVFMIAALVWFAHRRDDRPALQRELHEISEPGA